MKILQKQRLTVQKGKIQDRIDQGVARPVNDNVADRLLTQTDQFSPKGIVGVRHVDLWVEVKEVVPEKPKKEKSKDS